MEMIRTDHEVVVSTMSGQLEKKSNQWFAFNGQKISIWVIWVRALCGRTHGSLGIIHVLLVCGNAG